MASEYFLLMASPRSAASKWVQDEIREWLCHRSTERLTIVLTDGVIEWDQSAGDFDWPNTTALPDLLAGAFHYEPLWLDLRWARRREQVSLGDPRFRNAVATLSSELLQRPKDELIGDDIRLHRRTIGLAVAAMVGLAGLSAVAYFQRNEARAQRDRAVREARVATSRQLAAQAELGLDAGLDVSLLTAVEATAVEPTVEARSVLLRLLARNLNLEAILSGHPSLTAAFSPDGQLLATARGADVSLWNVASRSRRVVKVGQDAVATLAISPDRSLLAAVDGYGVARLWSTRTGERIGRPLRGPAIHALAFTSNGKRLVTAGSGAVSSWRLADRPEIVRRHEVPAMRGSFGPTMSSDRRVVAWRRAGRVLVWNVARRRVALAVDADGYAPTFAVSRDALVWMRNGKVHTRGLRGQSSDRAPLAVPELFPLP